MADPAITITAKQERRTQQEQIDQLLTLARAKQAVLRIRLPFSLYDYAGRRGYVEVYDAAWNLQLPADTTAETVTRLIETIGKCIVAIAEQGSEEVERKLEGA